MPMISPNDGSSCCVDSRPRIDHGSSHGPAAPAAQVEPVGGAQGSADTPVRCMKPWIRLPSRTRWRSRRAAAVALAIRDGGKMPLTTT